METILNFLILAFLVMLVVALIKPGAEIFNKISFLANKGNGMRRLIFTGVWFIATMVAVIAFSPSVSNVGSEAVVEQAKEYVVLPDSMGVVLKDKDTLRFDGNGNIEWTAEGMNVGSSARINIVFSEPVGVYPANAKFDSKHYNGFFYLGYSFCNGEYGTVGLYDFKDDNEHIRIGKSNDYGNVIKKKDVEYLQIAIDRNYKTQIKPIDFYDIKDFVDTVKVYVQNMDDPNTPSGTDGKREYAITPDVEAFSIILNGIFPNKND